MPQGYFNDHNHTQRAAIITPISELGKLRLREVRKLAQDPIAQILLITNSHAVACWGTQT